MANLYGITINRSAINKVNYLKSNAKISLLELGEQ